MKEAENQDDQDDSHIALPTHRFFNHSPVKPKLFFVLFWILVLDWRWQKDRKFTHVYYRNKTHTNILFFFFDQNHRNTMIDKSPSNLFSKHFSGDSTNSSKTTTTTVKRNCAHTNKLEISTLIIRIINAFSKKIRSVETPELADPRCQSCVLRVWQQFTGMTTDNLQK